MRGGVLFDLDGTIVDREPLAARAVAEVLVEQGHRVGEEALARLVGRSWPDIHADLGIEASVGWTSQRFTAVVVERCLDLGRTVDWRPLAGCAALIDALVDRGVELAVVTGSTRREADAVLAAAGIAGAFRVVVAADDYGRGKPDPEPYRLALVRLGLDPGRSVAVEDSAVGVRSARAAGLHVVAVGPGALDSGAAPGAGPGEVRRCETLADPDLREWVLGVVRPLE